MKDGKVLSSREIRASEPRDLGPVQQRMALARKVAMAAEVAPCEGGPGVRGEDPNGFYAAYFRDPDGNKLCVYKFGPDA